MDKPYVIVDLLNFKKVLPEKKWTIYLRYADNNFAEDKMGTMFYDSEKDVFKIN